MTNDPKMLAKMEAAAQMHLARLEAEGGSKSQIEFVQASLKEVQEKIASKKKK